MKTLCKGMWMVLAGMLAMVSVNGQTTSKKERKRELYFSWGYNKEWYTKSTVFVNQPGIGSNYQLNAVSAHDKPGWDEGLFSLPLSIPQYNYRLGLFIDRKRGIAVEINFDHTKYIIADQQVHLQGTVNNRTVDTAIQFNAQSGFYYFLNNGANFLLFNIVKRWHWYADKKQNFQVDFLGKFGVGPVIPHVENAFFGQKNDPKFQLGGWNVGIEAAVRATFFRYVFLEYSNKMDYARYSNLKVYEGTARQAFGTYEMILSLGVTVPVGGIIPASK